MTRYPDFFIAGAPKCGTTSLYSYLREHPDIFMPAVKEPHYFAQELSDLHVSCRSEAAYLGLFKHAADNAVWGEASIMYLFSGQAIEKAQKANPSAKFIILARNPVDMFFSLHAQSLKKMQEDIIDPEAAWNAQSARKAGKRIPNTNAQIEHLYYYDICALGTQIETLCKKVPESQRLLVLLDDLDTDPKGVYARILAFLGVPDDGRMDFPVKNKKQALRSKNLEMFISNPPALLNPLRKPLHALGIRPLSYLNALNKRKAPPAHIPAEFYARLENEFRSEIIKLQDIFQRDLSHWYRTPHVKAA